MVERGNGKGCFRSRLRIEATIGLGLVMAEEIIGVCVVRRVFGWPKPQRCVR